MSSDLPIHHHHQRDASIFSAARLGRRKRLIFFLLLATVFCVLWFNADLETINKKVGLKSSTENEADKSSGSHILIDEDLEQSIQDDQEENNTVPVTEQHDDAVSHPKEEQDIDAPGNNEQEVSIQVPKENIHLKYFVVIASRATNLQRRKLIRSAYFGLDDNLEPCMKKENKGLDYAFWLYGDSPQAITPESRLYEAEKMEWNDVYKVDSDVFDQQEIIEWAQHRLLERGATYDYLVIQDGYSFIHLPWIQETILAQEAKFDDGKKPGELIWSAFSEEKKLIILGSPAVETLFNDDPARDGFISGADAITNLFEYQRSISVQLRSASAPSDIKRLESKLAQLPRIIHDQNEHFIIWENDATSVPDKTVAVSNVYQDSDFKSLVKALRLETSPVCTSLNKPLTAVVTSSFIYKDSCMEPSAATAAENKRNYASRHGYAFVARSQEFAQQELRTVPRRIVWGKVDVIEKVLPKYDWLFWMDMDAVVMNQDISVHAILDDLRKTYPTGPKGFESSVDLVVVRPGRDKMLNAGVFLMRNTEWSHRFLKQVQATSSWYNKSPSYEQGAMWDAINDSANKEHVVVIQSDHMFNTFPQFYKPGDFVVHFAPDKCPNSAVLKGLDAAQRIENGEVITTLDED